MVEKSAYKMMQRISSLETHFRKHRYKVDILRKQIQLLLAESSIITDWIFQKFGTRSHF